MREALERIPVWAEKALQGLVFWIGHRHALYRGYLLSEGALVAEACNLIYANLGHEEVLHCEEQYSRLVPLGRWPADLGKTARADLVVVRRNSKMAAAGIGSLVPLTTAVIEAKRSSAPASTIDKDLERLATVKAANPGVRTFLFLVSESTRPRRFVSENGCAIRGETSSSLFRDLSLPSSPRLQGDVLV